MASLRGLYPLGSNNNPLERIVALNPRFSSVAPSSHATDITWNTSNAPIHEFCGSARNDSGFVMGREDIEVFGSRPPPPPLLSLLLPPSCQPPISSSYTTLKSKKKRKTYPNFSNQNFSIHANQPPLNSMTTPESLLSISSEIIPKQSHSTNAASLADMLTLEFDSDLSTSMTSNLQLPTSPRLRSLTRRNLIADDSTLMYTPDTQWMPTTTSTREAMEGTTNDFEERRETPAFSTPPFLPGPVLPRLLPLESLIYKCVHPYCKFTFDNLRELTVHSTMEHNGDKPYLCPNCRLPFRRSNGNSFDSVLGLAS